MGQALPGGRDTARPEGIHFPEGQRIDARFFGQDIHLGFTGRRGLDNGDPSHGPGHGVVGIDAGTGDIHMGHVIGAGDVNGGPHGQRRAVRRIGPGVEQHVRLHGQQPAVPGDPGFQADPGRVPLAGGQKHLFPGKQHFHRLFQVMHGQGDESLYAQIQLGSEPAARGGLNDADLRRLSCQESGHVPLVIMGILGAHPYGNAPGIIQGSPAGIRLQVAVFSQLGLIGMGDDDIALAEPFFHIPFSDGFAVQQVAEVMNRRGGVRQGLFRVEYRRQVLVGDPDLFQGLPGRRFGVCGHQGHGLALEPHFFVRQQGLILDYDPVLVDPGNVSRREHGRHPGALPGPIKVNVQDPGVMPV